MKILIIAGAFILLICGNRVYGKNAPTNHTENKDSSILRPLKIGDKVPDYTLKNLINYPATIARFSDFRGKLLLLDFWNTYCAACIEEFPKMLALQRSFNNRLQIILVNSNQNESAVRKAFSSRKQANVEVTLPTVCGDTVLNSLFIHETVPHFVWIDQRGFVISITAGDVVNARNIEAILDDQPVRMHQKSDEKISKLDFNKPLFVDGNGGNGDHLLWHSVLSEYFDGLYGVLKITTSPIDGYSITASNTSIKDMFRFAASNDTGYFGRTERVPLSQTILQVKDTSRFIEKSNGEIQYQNYYTYQLVSSRPVTQIQLQRMMLDDLKRYFDLDYWWEKRKVKCLVFTADDTSLISYKGGKLQSVFTDTGVVLNNIPMSSLIKLMIDLTKYYFSPYPIIDETGFTGRLGNIRLTVNALDFRALDKALKKYKIHFTLQEREVPILIIADAKSSSPSG